MSQSTTRYPPKQWGNNHLNMYTVSCIQFKGYFNISSQVSYKKLSFYNLKKLENPHINIAQNDTEANIQQSSSSMIVCGGIIKTDINIIWDLIAISQSLIFFWVEHSCQTKDILSVEINNDCETTLHKTSSVYKIQRSNIYHLTTKENALGELLFKHIEL